MLSERLKLARKRSGLSLRALSSGMGGIVSAQAIGKYERGEMMPSSDRGHSAGRSPRGALESSLEPFKESPLSRLSSGNWLRPEHVTARRWRERSSIMWIAICRWRRSWGSTPQKAGGAGRQRPTESPLSRIRSGQPLRFGSLGILAVGRFRTSLRCWRSGASRCSSLAYPVRWMA